MGVNFLEGFMDSSIILVSQAKGKKEPTFGEKFVSWTGPLDAGVWCMVLLLSVCVGSAYAFIEDGIDGSDMDRADANQNRVASVFSAFLLFTGYHSFSKVLGIVGLHRTRAGALKFGNVWQRWRACPTLFPRTASAGVSFLFSFRGAHTYTCSRKTQICTLKHAHYLYIYAYMHACIHTTYIDT